MKSGKSIIMSAMLIFSVLITTIVYSAFNTELQIKGEAIIRSNNEIRITGIEKVEYTAGAYEKYNSKYSKDTISTYITLAPNTSITYEVTISNNYNADYKIEEVTTLTNTNQNISIITNLKKDEVIREKASRKFELKFTNPSQNEQQITFVSQYKFSERNYVTIQKFSINDTTKFRSSEYKDKIKSITLSNEINEPSNVIASWNLGVNENSNVKGYLVINNTDATKYDLYIQGDGELYANQNSQYLFGGLTNLELINNLNILNTSKVTGMGYMFQGCRNIKELNLSNFNTENVTTMVNMFHNCRNIEELDLTSFNTSKVISMRNMFLQSTNLKNINLSSFNTQNTQDTNGMFYQLENITTIDISSFDTTKVTDSAEMFSGCTNLERIYVGDRWSTNYVTNSTKMFYGCSKIEGAVPYDATKIDKSMANYTTGYLTYKA